MNKRILVSFSGGADSTTLLYHMMQMYGVDSVEAVHFEYGSRHQMAEREAVTALAKATDKKIRTLSFDLVQFGRSCLTDPDQDIPAQHDMRQASTVVPYRNTMFLVNLAAIATVENFDIIALGPTFEDLAEYPDCRPEYFKAMQYALRLADRHYHLQILTPYITWRKSDVIELGLDMKIPYQLTHTCYEGHYLDPCRVCDACREREDSFSANGIVDPLITKESPSF